MNDEPRIPLSDREGMKRALADAARQEHFAHRLIADVNASDLDALFQRVDDAGVYDNAIQPCPRCMEHEIENGQCQNCGAWISPENKDFA